LPLTFTGASQMVVNFARNSGRLALPKLRS
jgi:hypothetical protein